MAVLKKNEFVYVSGQDKEVPTRLISNGEEQAKKKTAATAASEPETIAEDLELKAKLEEYERLKRGYIEEGERQLNEARVKAANIIEDAEIHAQMLREDAEKESLNIRKKAEETGYTAGFAAGEKPGYDEGYAQGQNKCKAALAELTGILNRLPSEKDAIFRDYENQLFDLIFTISNKVTAGCLKQKDKAVISRMLREAARGFRNSAYIKVSLSKLDIDETATAELDDLGRIFGEGQNVEFEILKDAPAGTLVLDNGSEIADAGIPTQLMMIENLGKGKFKNKPDDDTINN